MVVALLVGAIVVAAGFVLTGHHTKVMGATNDTLKMQQAGHRGFRLLKEDIKHAGLGVGHATDGAFKGLLRGRFQVPGGAEFNANDRTLSLGAASIPTDDLGIYHARGTARTIAYQGSGFYQICAGSGVQAGDLVAVLSRVGRYSRSVRIQSVNNAACLRSRCSSGCQTLSWLADSILEASPGALAASYAGGEIFADLKLVLWFVTWDEGGRGELRRAEINGATGCTQPDRSCGGVVAEGIDTLQVAVWAWDKNQRRWVNKTDHPRLLGADRLRIDVELMARTMSELGSMRQNTGAMKSEMASMACMPGQCSGEKKQIGRWALRGSVEIRNSGRMLIK